MSLIVVALCVACARQRTGIEDAEPLRLASARVLVSDASEAPPDNAVGWRAVALPDVWGLLRRRAGTSGWYRVEFRLDRVPERLQGLMIRSLYPNARVWLNGRIVGERGDVDAPGAQLWRDAFHVSIPPTLLHEGSNRLDVRYVTHPFAIGMLGVLEVGDDALVRREADIIRLLYVTSAQVFVIVALTMAGILVFVVARRDSLPVHAWFSAGLVLWSISALDVFVDSMPLSPAIWSWMRSVGFHGCLPCFALGFRRALGRPNGRIDAALVAALLGHGAVRALVPPLYAVAVDVVWIVVSLGIGIVLVLAMFESSRRGILVGGRLIGVAATIGIGLALHDIAGLAWGRSLTGASLYAFVPPVVILAAMVLQAMRLALALDESRGLNAELERRVQEKHDELERNHARLRRLEAERAVLGERERILRDMHDGLGGQLVSMLAQVENAGDVNAPLAEGLRAAIDELRLLIDSLDPTDSNLLTVLGTLRARLEPRLASSRVRISWQVRDVPQLRDFGPHNVLQVLRVVQEAFTNVTKHARATTITVRTGEEQAEDGCAGVFVEVEDDGLGLDPGARAGRGLASMRQRAASLGGHLVIASGSPGGTRVRLWLPL